MSRVKNFFHKIFPGWGLIKDEHKGRRRLVKNPKTGKYEFTEGTEAHPTTIEELQRVDKKVKKLFAEPNSMFVTFEPLRANRFIVEIMDFEPWVVQSFVKNSMEKEAVVEFVIPIATTTFDRLYELNDKLQKSKAEIPSVKIKDDVVLKLLDPVGGVVKKVVFMNVEVIGVGVLEALTYESNGSEILKGKIKFKFKSEINAEVNYREE